jgi:predicted transcriptional regulator
VKKTSSYRLSESTRLTIDQLSERLNLSKSEVIEQAIDGFVGATMDTSTRIDHIERRLSALEIARTTPLDYEETEQPSEPVLRGWSDGLNMDRHYRAAINAGDITLAHATKLCEAMYNDGHVPADINQRIAHAEKVYDPNAVNYDVI